MAQFTMLHKLELRRVVSAAWALLQLGRRPAQLPVRQVGAVAVRRRVEYGKNTAGHAGVALGTAGLVGGGAPAEPRQQHNEGDQVGDRRHERKHNFQLQKRERQFHLQDLFACRRKCAWSELNI